ncbi:MAG: cellulase family glycosylhydrolase [Sorangiineae bacterium]|nr:cellulase family glycosylhydrolase [Polyangiaceae bacterium]MEB2321568.1 cellulase family glycosylhydrolase [Sorangiineae bacterium]
MRLALLALPFALLAAGCGGSSDDAAPAKPAWSVTGGFVRAPDGRAALLRGANLADAHKDRPYLGFHEPKDYQALVDVWGMNTIRFLVIWAAIEPEKGKYDEGYLDRVAERVGWARDAGLHVVIDMHQDVYGEGFGSDGAPRWTCDEARYEAFEPREQWFFNYLDENVQACIDDFYASAELQDHYAEAWRRVAARLKDDPAVVGFDVMNEPHWGSATIGDFEAQRLQPFYEKIVRAVRRVAPGWLAFLEPSASRNLGFATGLQPFPFEGVVYSPHSYNSAAEQGNGFSSSARTALLNNVAHLADEARELGAALWIGEYGGTTGSDGITEYMNANYDAAGAVAAANAYWSYDRGDGGYGMLQADGTPKPVLLDVLVRPVPEYVAGDPISFEYDVTTRRFTFSWRPDARIDAPTVLTVPARVYPNGYDVDCDGCETEADGAKLTVTTAPRGEPAVITLRARP